MAVQLSHALRVFEVETRFFSTPQNESHLPELLCNLRRQLNDGNVVHIRIAAFDELCIKVRPQLAMPSNAEEVKINHVPLPIVSLTRLLGANQPHPWLVVGDTHRSGMQLRYDLTLLQVVPYINGTRTVRQISNETNVDELCVMKCVAHLVYYRMAILTDIYHVSNRYRLTNRFRSFITDTPTAVFKAASVYLVGGYRRKEKLSIKGVPSIPPDDVIRLYGYVRDYNLVPGKATANLSDVCSASMEMMMFYQISLRHFIAFGLMHSIIRRVHEYPIDARKTHQMNRANCQPQKITSDTLLEMLIKGESNLDYYQTLLELNREETIAELESLSSCIRWIFK